MKELSAYGIGNEVIYKYKLCRKNGVWQTKTYNSLIGGAALDGKVVAVDGENVKLHLTMSLRLGKSQNPLRRTRKGLVGVDY